MAVDSNQTQSYDNIEEGGLPAKREREHIRLFDRILLNFLPGTFAENKMFIGRIRLALFILGLYLIGLVLLLAFLSTTTIRIGKTVMVPKVEGMALITAMDRLQESGLRVEIEPRIFVDYPRGTVVEQSPRGGNPVKEGRNIHLVVSKGQYVTQMPNLRMLSYDAALSNLATNVLSRNSGLRVNDPVYIYVGSNVCPAGHIISHYPGFGRVLTDASEITLLISKGVFTNTVTVSNFVGQGFDAVVNYLESAEVNVEIEPAKPKLASEIGVVLWQSITQKTNLKSRDVIRLRVGARVDEKTGKIPSNIAIRAKQFEYEVPRRKGKVFLEVVLTDAFGKRILYAAEEMSGNEVLFEYRVYGDGILQIFLDKKELQRREI